MNFWAAEPSQSRIAACTQISDVEGELNGLTTYDRTVVKPGVRWLEAAQTALTGDASRATPAGCSTT
ncbi:hypothetical protein D9753_32140 [Streptomyces dangxiongensis]|uniref:Uncharacterized protein n=1 Tax=Streptomyces dangxiongensis TaxID=1442032 RepID=A0A3G2JMV3_9ACTN|nr:hypothetical protein [Streptomyces dangxiongensis]AYN42755.1 hypothetical protein D9753_32140 [Streptomyces dangxiongensis]